MSADGLLAWVPGHQEIGGGGGVWINSLSPDYTNHLLKLINIKREKSKDILFSMVSSIVM